MTDDRYGKIHADGSRSGGQPLGDSVKAKALALVNELFAESGGSPIDCAALFGKGDIVTLALLRAIEQHEAFKQEVSDIVRAFLDEGFVIAPWVHKFKRLIIPKPKPDPLVEVMKDWFGMKTGTNEDHANDLRAALEARGLEIREKGQ